MRHLHLALQLTTMALVISASNVLFAQQIAVQQPIVETFSVGTAVSVPDRGRMNLGSVGRAASSRSVYGPFPTSMNFGRTLSGSSASVGVFIHDLSSLDRQVLEKAEADRRSTRNEPVNRNAAHAYRVLQQRR